MRIADYEPREDLVYYLHELYSEFGQPSADNLAGLGKNRYSIDDQVSHPRQPPGIDGLLRREPGI